MATRELISALLEPDVWDIPTGCPFFDRWDVGFDPHPFHFGHPRHPRYRRPHQMRPHAHWGEPVMVPRRRHQGSNAGRSEVHNDHDRFQIQLDVSHYQPEELSVKTDQNSVVIHGKHEERADEYGYISREFTRRYMLPPQVEIEKVTSSLSPEGVLTVEAPKKALEAPSEPEKEVPISVETKPAVKEGGEAKE